MVVEVIFTSFLISLTCVFLFFFFLQPYGKFEMILEKVHDLSMTFMGRDPKDFPYDPTKFQMPPMGMGGGGRPPMFFGGGPPGGLPGGPPPTNGFSFPMPRPNGGPPTNGEENCEDRDSLTDGIMKVKVEPGLPDNNTMDNNSSASSCHLPNRPGEINGISPDMKPPAGLAPGSPMVDQEAMIYNMTLMGVIIRQTVTFTKAIPAFRRLSYEDQAVLIKNAILEILILRCAENYVPERNSVVDDVTGSEWSCEAMLASGFATAAEPTLKFVQTLHGMHLSRAELALLQAITIISPG